MRNRRQEAMLNQDCCCALCGHVFSAAETTCLHKQSEVVVCKLCNPGVVQIFALVERFGSPGAFVDHFAHMINFTTRYNPENEFVKNAIEEGCRVDGDRIIDKRGDIYDASGTVQDDPAYRAHVDELAKSAEKAYFAFQAEDRAKAATEAVEAPQAEDEDELETAEDREGESR